MAGTPDASLLVRAAEIGTEVGAKDLRRAKNLTDRLVARGQRVRLLRPARQIELGGLPGWLYIYSFDDPDTGQRGAHAHYFLFRGDTLITVVFQTLPSESFATYAPLFDRLEASFKADAAGS